MDNKATQVAYRLCYMAAILLVQLIYILININTANAHDVGIFIDKWIPFSKVFIIPYVYWYLYVFGSLVFFAIKDYSTYFRLLASIVTGAAICLTIYYIFPTTVPRPEVTGNDILSKAVRFIYWRDRPFNCFPSIHVLYAVIVSLFISRFYKTKAVKWFSAISFLLITLSTMFIKQHYFFDAVSGILLGVSLFLLYSNVVWSHLLSKRLLDFMLPEHKVRDSYID